LGSSLRLCVFARKKKNKSSAVADENKKRFFEPIWVNQKVAEGTDIEEDVLTFFFNLEFHGAHYP